MTSEGAQVSNPPSEPSSEILRGKRLAFVGRLASMPRREAAQLVRRHGAVVVDRPDASVHLLVIGEELPLGEEPGADDPLDAATRQAIEQGGVEVLRETQLWQRLGMVEAEQEVHRLYTPAMLAGLLSLPVAVIRRWHRRGLIVPVREVRRLPYFDFREVATARRLAELLAAGMSPAAIEKKLAALARYVPEVERPLAQLSVIVEGREILLRQGDGLVEPGGQLRFDFAAAESARVPSAAAGAPSVSIAAVLAMGARAAEPAPASAAEISRLAAELEESGQLVQAAEMYRAAMAAGGPTPELCFQVAELLYRLGDLGGARERYFMAIELDENYVEARANLGCVLAELGERELAAAAFQGALAFHPDYADAHYHLDRTLDDLGRPGEAQTHWEAFLGLAADSPWALQARNRLAGKPPE
jgi:DNA-binding transcriptional MerR regulator